jgi:hypothetical protein
MTTVCNIERDALKWACVKLDGPYAETYAALPEQPLPESRFTAKRDALLAVQDPSKLASIIAELLRERQLFGHCSDHCGRAVKIIDVRDANNKPVCTILQLKMPEARKLVVALLEAKPDTGLDELINRVCDIESRGDV